MPKKAIKDSEGFIVNFKKKRGKPMFFVRYKDILPSTPVDPKDLSKFLLNKIKEISKKSRQI